MSTNSTVVNHAITVFSAKLHERAQQLKSRLRPYVDVMPLKGKQYAYDGIGTVEAREVNGRYSPVIFDEIEHFRRRIRTREFAITLPIAESDIEERLQDPQGYYINAIMAGMERRLDRLIVSEMFADVYTGENMDTVLTYANDGGVTLDCTAGLTYEKFLEGNENFIDNEVGNDGDVPFVMGLTGSEHTSCMTELELTSGDYSREYVVDKGTIQKAAGINLIKFAANGASAGADPILPVSAGVRTSFLMAKGAMVVGMTREMKVAVEPRADLHNTKQIKVTGRFGALRTEGKLIQKVTFTA